MEEKAAADSSTKGGARVNCPFCAEEIRVEAVVCRFCSRDLTIPKPLMEANKALVARVSALELELVEVKARKEHRPKPAPEPELPPEPPGFKGYAIGYLAVPIALLLVAHYLMIIKFDVNPLFLRAASILIPLPFGYSLFRRTRPRFLPTIVIGLVSGIVAVGGMNALVGLVDNVSMIPADARDWRESFEYALSIALAFLLGGLLAQGVKLVRATVSETLDHDAGMSLLGNASKWIAIAVGSDHDGTFSLAKRIQSIEKLLNSAIASATAAASIYAGVKAFL